MRTLRARALLRLSRPAEAHAALRGLWLDNDVVRGEVAMLQSAAAARLGEHAAAAQLQLTARAYVFSTDEPALEAEVEYYTALSALGESELQQAAAASRRLLQITPSDQPARYIVPLRHVRARTFELLGFMRAARGDYAAQVPLTFKALDEFRRSRVRDGFQEAQHVAVATMLARDFDLEDRASDVRSHVEAMRWTHDTADLRFQCLEALGWCAALHGDHVGALRYFRRAGEASTMPQEVQIAVARASLAYELEQRYVAAEEVGHALDLAERFDWERSRGHDRLTLVWLAQAAAPLETARARAALDRYGRIRAAPEPPSLARFAERVDAEEAFAEGVVARAEGNVPLANIRLRAAFERWAGTGYAWRAARAATELVELGAGEPFRQYLRHELTVRASSWFVKRAAAASDTPLES